MADDVLECRAHEVSETAIGGPDFTFERYSDENVVERIDQVPVTLLGTLDDGEQLVEMFIAGSSSVPLLDAADEPAKFGNLLVTPPNKDNEGCNKKYKNRAGGKQVLKSASKGSDGVPRDRNVGDRQQTKEKIRQPPQLTLAPFKLGEPFVEVCAWRIKGSSRGLRILPIKLGHSGGCVLCGVLQNPPLSLLFSRLAAHPAKRRMPVRSRRVPARPTMFKCFLLSLALHKNHPRAA